MNKITIALSALVLLAAGSAGAMAAPANAGGEEPNGQPINMAQLPSQAVGSRFVTAVHEPDLLSLWANEGVISEQNADQIRAQIEQKGAQPGTFAYDQQAGAYAFPNQNSN